MSTPATTPLVYDPVKFSANMAAVAAQSQKLIQEFMSQAPDPNLSGMANVQAIGAAFIQLTEKMMSDPARVATAAVELWAKRMETCTAAPAADAALTRVMSTMKHGAHTE